jgi:hypothetical protein
MRALGRGSVSSFLKRVLDVVYLILWGGLAVVGLLLLAALVLSVEGDLLARLAKDGGGAAAPRTTVLVSGLAAAGLYVAGLLVIVDQLRRIFLTLSVGDPFHPDNVRRLRTIGVALAAVELVRYLVWALGAWVLPGVDRVEGRMSFTAWFAVLVVFVLAEVFREGARLRRESELTI